MITRYRLIIGALSAIVVVLVLLLVWSSARSPQQAASTPPQSSTGSTPTPSFNESAGDADQHDPDHASDDDENEAAWRPIVEGFARNYTNTSGGPTKWRSRLIGDPGNSRVTSEVAKQLATVDIANVPQGHYTGYESLKASAYEAAVKVTYQEGWAMVLYLITDGTAYQVYAYDKWEQ